MVDRGRLRCSDGGSGEVEGASWKWGAPCDWLGYETGFLWLVLSWK